MPTEKVTGISFPDCLADCDSSACLAVVEAVASCCAQYLLQGGYFSDLEVAPLLKSYKARLESPAPPDFLVFAAEAQAARHSLTMEGEVHRMQVALRHRLVDRVHCWTFGTLPGRATSLYDYNPSLRPCCALLGCPAMLAGDVSVVHVASINPVAVLVASAWVNHELTLQSGGEAPFVFPFMIDLPVWSLLLQRHFSA